MILKVFGQDKGVKWESTRWYSDRSRGQQDWPGPEVGVHSAGGSLCQGCWLAVLRGFSQAKHRHNGVVRKAGEVNAYGALVDRQTHRIQHQWGRCWESTRWMLVLIKVLKQVRKLINLIGVT